jgi:hypothetical protein
MEVDRTGSPLCPAAGIGIICVYPSAPYTKELGLQLLTYLLTIFFILLVGGGVQQGPLGTPATDWPIVACPG